MSESDSKFDRAQKALEGLSDQFYEGDLEGLFDSEGSADLGGESDTPVYDALSRLDQHYEERGLIGRGGMKEVFTGNAFEVFALTLEGKSVEEISSELGLRKDSIYVLRNRVKGRLQREIQQLRHDLEVGDE